LWPPLVLLYMVQQVTHKQEVQYYHELQYVQNVQYSLDISQYPQSRQSAKDFFLQSCELRHTTPSPAGECVPRGGTHSLAGEGGGGPIRTRRQTLWYFRYICASWQYLYYFI
jgi:hypothetical protein